MRRGSIYWINLGKMNPPEMGKTRPAIIVSNSEQNEILDSVIVIPLSSQAPEIWPLRVRLEIQKGKASFAIVPGLRQVSKARLAEQIGQVSEVALHDIDEAIRTYLAD